MFNLTQFSFLQNKENKILATLCLYRVYNRLHRSSAREARASGAPQLRKFGNLSIRESVMTIQTLGEGEGSQESARWGRSML